jgi:hypothetical protein
MKYDSQVKTWSYWRANVPDDGPHAATPRDDLLASLGRDSGGISKDTTHMSVVDKDGNLFDATPSGGWITGAVILGDTGIGMSVRGEQFWLDKMKANQGSFWLHAPGFNQLAVEADVPEAPRLLRDGVLAPSADLTSWIVAPGMRPEP